MVAADGGVIDDEVDVFAAANAGANARKFGNGSDRRAFDDFDPDFTRTKFDDGIRRGGGEGSVDHHGRQGL